jgi:hypothetical protein
MNWKYLLCRVLTSFSVSRGKEISLNSPSTGTRILKHWSINASTLIADVRTVWLSGSSGLCMKVGHLLIEYILFALSLPLICTLPETTTKRENYLSSMIHKSRLLSFFHLESPMLQNEWPLEENPGPNYSLSPVTPPAHPTRRCYQRFTAVRP